MALIKCPNCNHDISDTVSKCIHCGKEISNTQTSNAPRNIEKKENFKIKLQNTKETDLSSEFTIKFNKNIIVNMIFTFIFLILIYELRIIITKHSGTYTIINFTKWLLRNYVSYTLANNLDFIIVIYLIICFLASCSNKAYNKFSKISYCFIFIVEIVFFISIYLLGYELKVVWVIIPIFTIIWVIIEFYLLGQGKQMETNNINNVKNMNNNNLELKSKQPIYDLEKLQDLLNKKVITDKEYKKLKKAVIKNIIGK